AGSSLRATHANHITRTESAGSASTLYRVPHQASLDGNTVDTQIEQQKFAENAMRYQTTLRFLNGKISGMMKAIKGE
ncbi:MAG: flagellar basal body rod protein FlgB, partial [Thiohalobacterales bacterium]|nr:flagellar basal body rod protein FlgB [Thiohalobacterales bacterium]